MMDMWNMWAGDANKNLHPIAAAIGVSFGLVGFVLAGLLFGETMIPFAISLVVVMLMIPFVLFGSSYALNRNN